MADLNYNNNNENINRQDNVDSIDNAGSTDSAVENRTEVPNDQNGASVNYTGYTQSAPNNPSPSAPPQNNAGSSVPNGEYHYGYRGSYNPSYNNTNNTNNRNPYSGSYYGNGGAGGYGYDANRYSHYNTAYNNAPNNGAQSAGQYGYTPAQPAYKPKKEKKSSGVKVAWLMLVLCLLISGASGFGGVMLGRALYSNDGGSDVPNTPSVSGQNTGSVIVVNPSDKTVTTGTYADVATAVKDTVVEISTETVQTSTFFGQYVTGGAGSGVIISADGLILTNYHVIEGASKITARLADGTEYEATVSGSDSDTDIALLKIDGKSLKFAAMGNSDALVVGQEVVAIGNPLGELGGSVTNGIISALDREVEIGGELMNLLQTNAAVNPGNSGGGLFNLAGELIGVVNAKSSGSGIEGLGFAIPINDAVTIIRELSEYGYVRGRVYLGIEYNEIAEITMQYYYYGYTKPGIYVVSSPLNTELKKNDRIVAIDDVEISTSADIKAVLREHKVGDTLKVTVVRNGRNTNVTVTCYEYVPDGIDTNIDFETSEN